MTYKQCDKLESANFRNPKSASVSLLFRAAQKTSMYTVLQRFHLYRTHKKEAADRRKSTVFGDQAKMIRDTFGKGVKTATDTGKVLWI